MTAHRWLTVLAIAACAIPLGCSANEAGTDQPAPARPVEVALGLGFGCARLDDSSVMCWGNNEHGQLADGTTTSRYRATRVSGLSNVVQLALGYTQACALLADASVSCWGNNESGQLGNGTVEDKHSPTHVPGLSNVAELALGGYGSLVRLTDGTVHSLTNAYDGETADGAKSVPGLSTAVQIAYGRDHGCALLADDAVRCWGDNRYGQLGDGTEEDRSTPVSVPGLSNVAEIAVGTNHTCARLIDGTVRCWGRNQWGRLGNGTTVDSSNPKSVVDLRNRPGKLARLVEEQHALVGGAHLARSQAPIADHPRHRHREVRGPERPRSPRRTFVAEQAGGAVHPEGVGHASPCALQAAASRISTPPISPVRRHRSKRFRPLAPNGTHTSAPRHAPLRARRCPITPT